MNTKCKPENNKTNAARQARLRERRKAQGFKRVSVWLSPDQVNHMERQGGEPWLGRIVKQLLESAARPVAKPVALFTVPGPDPEKRITRDFEPEPAAAPVSDNAPAHWREADSLNKAGLSWAEIARQWNEQGRRTEKGAEYRGANIAREIRKLKGKGE